MAASDQEIGRSAFEAFARGDIDGAQEFSDPDIVIRDPGRTGRTIAGLDAERGEALASIGLAE